MFCRLQVAGCRLQVAGCGLKFNYNWKTAGTYKNVQAVDLPWLLHDPVYDRSVRLLPPSCQTGRSDGRRVYCNDFKPAMKYWFGINVWNIVWNSCWIWFFPREYQNESAQWACANIFRRLKSYIILFLYLFDNHLLLREDPSQIWNRCKHLWSGHPDCFEEISLCRSITTYQGHPTNKLSKKSFEGYFKAPCNV